MKRFKSLAGYVVVVLTLSVFAWYIKAHPNVIDQLKQTSLFTVVAVLLLYGAMTVVLAVLYDLLLKLCGAKISHKENLLLTMYSSVVNFFGPLQSGPGFRMVYVKKRFGVRIASYLGANILYYIVFAAMSGLFLLSGLIGPFGMVGLALVGAVLAKLLLPYILQTKRFSSLLPTVTTKSLGLMAAVTFAQLLIVTTIYFVELRSLTPGVSYSQAMIYAGAANFSLFVSLTPGALGFRETFLLFTQRLHHIDSVTIVTANILDRGLYVVFLGILFLIILLVHGKDQLQNFKAPK